MVPLAVSEKRSSPPALRITSSDGFSAEPLKKATLRPSGEAAAENPLPKSSTPPSLPIPNVVSGWPSRFTSSTPSGTGPTGSGRTAVGVELEGVFCAGDSLSLQPAASSDAARTSATVIAYLIIVSLLAQRLRDAERLLRREVSLQPEDVPAFVPDQRIRIGGALGALGQISGRVVVGDGAPALQPVRLAAQPGHRRRRRVGAPPPPHRPPPLPQPRNKTPTPLFL